MRIWILVAVVWGVAAIAGVCIFRRRHGSDDTPLTDRWRADHTYEKGGDHNYEKGGDRRWK